MSTPLVLPRPTTRKEGASDQTPRWVVWTLFIVCVLYAAQLWTPLRLTGDSIELLAIAASAADGHGFLNHGTKTHYLPGYPAMVIGLERVGAARPWGLVGLNAFFLVIGLAAAYYVARRHFHLSSDWALRTILFTLLSFALVKHFTLPLTDIPFFGISMVAVALVVRAEEKSGAAYFLLWAVAVVTSSLAVLIRPIAIALFPSLAWSMATHFGVGEILRRYRRAALMAGSLIALLLVVAASVLLLEQNTCRKDSRF
jgi:hypothetical protein